MKKQKNKSRKVNNKVVRDVTVDEYGLVVSIAPNYVKSVQVTTSSVPTQQAKAAIKQALERKADATALAKSKGPLQQLSLPMHSDTQSTQQPKPISDTPQMKQDCKTLENRGFVPCPICGVKLHKTRLNHHLKNVHAHQSTQLPLPQKHAAAISIKTKPKQTTSHSLIKCPECEASVRVDRIKKHLENVHGINAYQTKIRTIRTPATVDYYLETNGGAFYEDEQDGGKYLSHLTRENGKFGSLPIFDDYSDEAGAD